MRSGGAESCVPLDGVGEGVVVACLGCKGQHDTSIVMIIEGRNSGTSFIK